MAANPVPLRADAQRNLERILVAAREAFAQGGLEVGVEEIVRRAGVGKGTFFRRFPTKDALILAVLIGFMEEIEASAERAVQLDDPMDGLRAFLMDHIRLQADNVAFFDAVAARFSSGLVPPIEITERGQAAVARVLEPANAAGLLRPGIEPGDISTMLKMLGAAVRPMPGMLLAQPLWDRFLELALSGIRAGQPPLPAVAVDPCAMARERIARTA